MSIANVAERVWRVRKNHTSIDAQIRDDAADGSSEVQFYYDGTLVLSRRWPSRADALAHASRQLTELQRAGWNTHW
jgi:hypothetical protein